MKLRFFILFVVAAAGFAAGKNAQKTTPPVDSTAPAQQSQEGQLSNWNASHVTDAEQPDSAYPYQAKRAPQRVEVPWDKLPRPSTSRRAFMATGYWSAIMAFQPSDTTVHRNFLGKYLKFT